MESVGNGPGTQGLSSAGLVATRIKSVTAVPISIPMATPTRFSTRTVAAREFVFVWVEADNGARGFGYTYVGTVGARATAQLVADAIGPQLIGSQAFGPGRVWQPLYQELLLIGRRGLVLRAMSAIDIALWDLLGVTLGAPLYMLLGGERDTVPAYASGGYYGSGEPLASVEKEMVRHLRRGFTDVKMKVGGEHFDVDVQRVRVARETIGPSCRLALDANNAWRTPEEALRFVRAVEKYEPWWIEEPLSPDDLPGHLEISKRTQVPVATGEIHATRWEFRDMLVSRACAIAQPDAGVLGGVSEWLKVAHLAEAFSVPVAPHWNANIHVHLAAAVGNCLTVEYFPLEEGVFAFESLVAERLDPTNGLIPVPQRPGLGIVLDDRAVDRARIDW